MLLPAPSPGPTMTVDDDMYRLMGEISTSLETLSDAVDELAIDQAGQLTRTRLALRWTICGLAVDLVLTVLGGFLWLGERHTSNELKAVNSRVSTQALCPLYELFLRSYNPQSPQARDNPAEYDRSFSVIEQGARTLGCANAVRGH